MSIFRRRRDAQLLLEIISTGAKVTFVRSETGHVIYEVRGGPNRACFGAAMDGNAFDAPFNPARMSEAIRHAHAYTTGRHKR